MLMSQSLTDPKPPAEPNLQEAGHGVQRAVGGRARLRGLQPAVTWVM